MLSSFWLFMTKFCFKKVHRSDNSLLQVKSSNEKARKTGSHIWCKLFIRPVFLFQVKLKKTCFSKCWLDTSKAMDEESYNIKGLPVNFKKNYPADLVHFTFLLGIKPFVCHDRTVSDWFWISWNLTKFQLNQATFISHRKNVLWKVV